MIPLRSSERTDSTASALLIIILLNVLVFLYEISLPRYALNAFIMQYGIVPDHFHYSSLITSMFMHGGFFHIAGNMWFLWIFGDNVEDYLGHFTYLIFYLLSGVAAALAQVVLTPSSIVPTIGASGAIAGVLGAYFILYPRARVLTWFFVFFVHIPAWVVLGYWFVLQFLSGAATSLAYAGNSTGGIAFWAHVGGFIAGMVMVKLFPERPRRDRYGAF